MTLKSVQFVRAKDGTERVVLDLAEFQALLDAAESAKRGPPDVQAVVEQLRTVLASECEYVDAGTFLDEYDAAHHAR
jgi:hypothetical protein